jgi:hypothetical protein
MDDGRIVLVWREGTDHVTSHDGVIKWTNSTDNGLTWSPTVQSMSQSGFDLRDPSLSTSPDRTKLYLTYFKATTSLAAAGFFIQVSTDRGATWGGEHRIDGGQPYAAGASPVVTLANGNLLATWYGKDVATNTYDSSWTATSSDGGVTWSAPHKLLDGPANLRDYQEPWAVVSGTNVVVMYRDGNAQYIGRIASADSGATWGAGAPKFDGTGRPSTVLTSSGTLVTVFRSDPAGPASNQRGYMRTSPDLGVSWTEARLVERSAWGGGFWTYSAPIEVAKGMILCPTGVEQSGTSSVLSTRYLVEGEGISPFGDVPMTPAERVTDKATRIAAVDDFDRVNGPLGWTRDGVLWLAPAAVVVDSGTLRDQTTTASNFSLIDTMDVDYDIEAEIQWQSPGTSGIYLVGHYQNNTNYYMFGIETNGVNGRLYKVVGGTATQLGTTAALMLEANHWGRVRLSFQGTAIRAYYEDSLVVSVADSSLPGAQLAGIRTGSANTGNDHRVRNFIIRRRGGAKS